MTPIEFMHAYEQASAAHDLEATLALIDEDAVYFFSNETAHVGKAAVRAAIAANFAAIRIERFEIRDVQCLLDGAEMAVCIYAFRWSGEIDGRAVSGGGRGTTALRRRGDSWRVVHEHLSRGPFIE